MHMILPVDPSDRDDHKKPFDPTDKDADCFKPPADPVEVGCLHCGQVFMSDQMTYRIGEDSEGKPMGFWCCPDPLCSGRGFGFDLLPTDPNYRDENGGWVHLDDEEDEFDEWDDEDDLDGPSDGFDPPKDWTGDDDDEDIPF